MNRIRIIGPVLVGLALLLPLGCGGGSASEDLKATPVTTVPGPYDYEYVIPAGTAYEISLGNDPKIMPDSLDVKVGQTVATGDRLLVLEAMKMKTPVMASRAGQVTRVLVAPGDAVEGGQPLVTIA